MTRRPEDALTILVANMLRRYTELGLLKAVWCHPANEGRRSPREGARAKQMGLVPGTPDFVFLGSEMSGFIELKAPPYYRIDKNGKRVKVTPGLEESQREFCYWCDRNGVPWALCRSVDEVESQLIAWGMLKVRSH